MTSSAWRKKTFGTLLLFTLGFVHLPTYFLIVPLLTTIYYIFNNLYIATAYKRRYFISENFPYETYILNAVI